MVVGSHRGPFHASVDSGFRRWDRRHGCSHQGHESQPARRAQAYVVMARAKGLREWRIVLKYPVRIALNPLVSTMGYLLPFLMSGSIIVSVVLSLPTEGPLLLRSLLSEDLFMSATILFVLGALTVIGTLLSDIALGFLDPRIRYVR